MRLPTYVDRYPAKMVSRLAGRLLDRYASNAEHVFDPFSGSAAILSAAAERGIRTTGCDINPLAQLFHEVKIRGFNAHRAFALGMDLIQLASERSHSYEMDWQEKEFWFTSGTIAKLEGLRGAWRELRPRRSPEAAAVLLSFALAIRLCSRADQRSPKPFISKHARLTRKGMHYDPSRKLLELLADLSSRYPARRDTTGASFFREDITSPSFGPRHLDAVSHVVTSPPYVNAQDYFRNFKLELFALEGLLPFAVASIKESFIGTERGNLIARIPPAAFAKNAEICEDLPMLTVRNPRLAAVLHRYLFDMDRAFDNVLRHLAPRGTFILVCGDNLLGGIQIHTWRLLDELLRTKNLRLVDRFSDTIGDRMLAPKRLGHKGLIKQEIVSAYSR